MIQLVTRKLSDKTSEKLKELQGKVNTEKKFQEKASKAKDLWKNKNRSKSGKLAFEEVRQTLGEMSISEGICNYCEHNVGNDIEHISPKSFFPEKAFVWKNYLLACKLCNTGYKLDKCSVLDPQHRIIEVKRGQKPKYKTVALINPRIENPNRFMVLELQTYTYKLHPNIQKKDENKARETIRILKLNERDVLISMRRKAEGYYYDRVDRLVKILKASSKPKLQILLSPIDKHFDFTKKLKALKTDIKLSYKNDIKTHAHPSVWHSIKTIESKVNPKWIRLFQALPEALLW